MEGEKEEDVDLRAASSCTFISYSLTFIGFRISKNAPL